MKKILVVGVGSILRRDDGVGQRVVDELERERLPRNVKLHSGDVSGLDLLKVFPGYDEVVIIDAADMKSPVGAVKVFNADDMKKSGFNNKFSTHGISLLDTLTLADRLGLKCEIRIIGIQPEDTSFGLKLSDEVQKSVVKAKECVWKIIKESR
jgi:hydrogenase maturation protease